MTNLVYKRVKTFSQDSFEYSQVNYLCKDNYVHIRLGRFGDKPQKICGFENKLTLLLTLVMRNKVSESLNLSQLKLSESKENYQEIWKQCVDCLKSSKEYKDIEYVIKTVYEDCKGIKLLPMYSIKHKPKNAFDLLGDCINLPDDANIFSVLECDMHYEFADILDFLFNNNVAIYIEPQHKVDDTKFVNKYTEIDTSYNLWED